MKEILISIQPKWCELIVSGKKTVEVRKTRPKIDTPFKCYIYCTKAKEYFSIGSGVYAASDELYRLPTGEIKFGDSFELMGNWSGQYDDNNFLNGKVIGEFVCDQLVWVVSHPFIFAGHDLFHQKAIDDACLTNNEVEKYSSGKDVFGWHISDLVIYDEPKELSEFRKYISFLEGESISELEEAGMNNIRLKRPPQSWCYVEGR